MLRPRGAEGGGGHPVLDPPQFGALILGSRRSSLIPGKRDGGNLCRSGAPAAEQMTRHAAALRGFSRGPLGAFFSSGSSHNSILKLEFAAADS